MDDLKAYVWADVYADVWTNVVIVLATSEEEARELINAKFSNDPFVLSIIERLTPKCYDSPGIIWADFP